MKCRVDSCNCEDESKIELHHIVPRCCFSSDYEKNKKYDMVDIYGTQHNNRIALCKKHHDIISGILFKSIYNLIIDKDTAKKTMINLTKWFLTK